jgi:hypothetical protein
MESSNQVFDRGVEGNAWLTAVTGLVLVLLLAVEGVTILRIGQLLALHVFIGILLVGPVLLKDRQAWAQLVAGLVLPYTWRLIRYPRRSCAST